MGTFPTGNPLYGKPQFSINPRRVCICLMWMTGAVAWECCRIFTEPTLPGRRLPIPHLHSSTTNTITPTALPHSDADYCLQPQTSFKKTAQKVLSEFGQMYWAAGRHHTQGWAEKTETMTPWELQVYTHTVKTSVLRNLSKNIAYFGVASKTQAKPVFHWL